MSFLAIREKKLSQNFRIYSIRETFSFTMARDESICVTLTHFKFIFNNLPFSNNSFRCTISLKRCGLTFCDQGQNCLETFSAVTASKERVYLPFTG